MVIKQPTKYKIHKKDSVFGASVSELHTSELNDGIFLIYVCISCPTFIARVHALRADNMRMI